MCTKCVQKKKTARHLCDEYIAKIRFDLARGHVKAQEQIKSALPCTEQNT